jgi:hypothetical protein
MSFLAENFWAKTKWAEWLFGPKNSNWPKNILTNFQSLMTDFSKNIDFKHKIAC